MESEYRIFRLNDEGKEDFIWEYNNLSEHSQGPIIKTLLSRMKNSDVFRYDVCLPNVLLGDILKYSNIFIDLDTSKKNFEILPSYVTKLKLCDENIKNTFMGDVADEWLVDTAFKYLSSGKNRICVVQDMMCYGQLQPVSLCKEMDRYYKNGDNEGYFIFYHGEDIKYFRECVYYGIMMSYGFFASLPDSISIDDIMRDNEAPMPLEMAEMLAKNVDAVYVGSHDALRYMIGWFNQESIPY